MFINDDLIGREAVVGFLRLVAAVLSTPRPGLPERTLHVSFALDRLTGPAPDEVDFEDATAILRAWLTGAPPADTPASMQPPWRLWGLGGRILAEGPEDVIWGRLATTTTRPLIIEAPLGTRWELR